MSMTRLAFLNFKQSFRNHLALIVSQAFTVLVLFNFQVISPPMPLWFWERGTKPISTCWSRWSLSCWDASCSFSSGIPQMSFLTSRKKAIGLYVFMGLSNEKIGQMYLIETLLTGLSALALGWALAI